VPRRFAIQESLLPERTMLTGGLLVDPGSGTYGIRDVLIEDGRVLAVAVSLFPFDQWRREGGLRIWDLKGCYVFPGLVDIHTHLRVPGEEHKEDLRSGTLAAAAGGFTTVAVMPNTRPSLDRAVVLRQLRKRIAAEARVRVEMVGAVTVGRRGRRLTDLGALQREGAVAFSDDGSPVVDARLMRQAMLAAGDLGCPVISHCEDKALAGAGVMHEGEVATRLGLPGISGSAEEVMVARDLCLAAETGAHLHLAHLSTARSIGLVREAKARGVRATAEVTPHHLLLTEEAVLRSGTNAKVNPPLRTAGDCRALQEALRDGTVEAVASDHAPHHPGEKALSMQEAPFGVIGLETTLPLLLSLVGSGAIGLVRAVELLTIGPAGVLGLPRGRLREGDEADLTVYDPACAYFVDVERFHSKARNCPFAGRQLEGKAVLALLGGREIWRDQDCGRRVTTL